MSHFVVATVAAARAWGRVLTTSAGVAAVAGAGQLGVAYGLQLVRFRRDFPSSGIWASQLTWATWFATLAVVAGAAGGVWTARRLGRGYGGAGRLQLGQRIAVALAAALGATVTVLLTALPARDAGLAGADPALEAVLATTLGLVVGVLAAVAVLSLRVVGVSVTAIIAVVWLVAVVSVAPTLGPAAEPAMVRLGVLDLAAFGQGSRSAVAAISPPAIALLVGVAVAAAARSIGLPLLRTVLAGAAGPVLLVLPYLIAPPRGGEDAVQGAAFGGAVIAVVAGPLAAVAVAVFRLPGRGGRDAGAAPGDPYLGGAPGVATVPPAPEGRYGGYGTGSYGWAGDATSGEGADARSDYPATRADFPATAADFPATAADYPTRRADYPATTADYPTDPAIPRPRAFDDYSPAADPPEPAEPATGKGDVGMPWPPPATEPAVGTRVAETPATETPVTGSGETGSPAGGREPLPPAAPPEPAPPAASPQPDRTSPQPDRTSPRWRRRQERHDEEHVEWLRTLAGTEPSPELSTGDTGRRRLRRDQDPFADDDLDPELKLPGRYGRTTDDG